MPRTVLVAVLVAVAMPAAAQTITKARMREQAPEVTVRELKDQLWAMFVPEDFRGDPRWPPVRVLETETMVTRPYPVGAGLCRRDTLQMRFTPEPRTTAKTDAKTPVRAHGLDSWHGYRLGDPGEGRWGRDDSNWDERGWAVCAAQAGERFVGADNDIEAAGGLYAMREGLEAVAGGRIVPTCQTRYAPGVTCESVYARTIEKPPLWLKECDLPVSGSHNLTCFAVQFPGNLLVFRRAETGGAVVSVEVVGVSVIDDSALIAD